MDLLFHHDVVVATLASGSRGNCTYVGSPQSGILVDCGLSTRQILDRMKQIGLGGARIDGVVITHEHSDHCGAARVLHKRLLKLQGRRVPFYMTRGTERGLNPRCRPDTVVRAVAGQSFPLGAWVVDPYAVPHDVQDPVGYVLSNGDVNVGVVTDLGRSTRMVERQLSRCDIAVVEFNHNLEMLLDGPYPWSLKQRVRSNHGHLSNAQSAELVTRGATSRLKHLVLAHLSEDNNLPELAREAAMRGLYGAGLKGVEVRVATQQLPLGPMRIRTPKTFQPGPGKPRTRRPRPVKPAIVAPQAHRVPQVTQLSLFG